jgi:glycosyltransferase involved in cell wall biosynthesis
MRIVFVLSGFGAGGAEKIVNLLAHHRMAAGDDVHVLALNAHDSSSYFDYSPGIELIALSTAGGALDRISSQAAAMLRLRRQVVAIRPDLIISFLTKVNIMVRIACAGLKIPIILSERNNFRSQGMHAFWRIARPVVARGAARLVMQTEEARSSLPAVLRARAVVIPNPVAEPGPMDDAFCSPGARIVAVGRMEAQKGFDLLLDAFKLAAYADPRVSLTIYGDGPLRSSLEDRARALGIAGRVSMPGITKTPGEWVAGGDIFVLSSRFEGFPNVLLEAMMAGMASIAFACPWGPSEILDEPETGVLVPEGDVRLLAMAMRLLAGDPKLRKTLGSNGARIARARYAMPAVLAMWDAVIRNSTA